MRTDMRSTTLKRKVTALRKSGSTYSEIQKVLGVRVPKSTLSYWCKKVPLPDTYEQKIEKLSREGASRGRAMALIVNKARRGQYIESLTQRNTHLAGTMKDTNVAKIALAMLYLGEGAKWRSHRGLALGSSDPDVIKIYLSFLEQCYGIKRGALKVRILHRADQNLVALTSFWKKITAMPGKNFYKTQPDPRTKGKKTKKKTYKGVCVISGGSTEIQLELDIIARMFLKI